MVAQGGSIHSTLPQGRTEQGYYAHYPCLSELAAAFSLRGRTKAADPCARHIQAGLLAPD